MRVLIVEGSAERGTLWMRHLERLGHRVELTDAHEVALHAIRFRSPDVIVLNLAHTDARPLVIADVAGCYLPTVRVIFVTGGGFFSDGSIFALARNACAVVPEGVTPEDLDAMIMHYGSAAS
jgi:DNA-binding response OmpR family regulator